MDNKEVLSRLILSCNVGSRAYGTHLPTSDADESGVCIPNIDHYLGVKKFEQANKWTDENGEKIDKTIYSLDKIVDLCLQNNPNCLDLLYIPERCIIKITPEWERIMEIRDSFLSKKIKYSFSGYSFAQFSRLESNRSYLRNPVNEPKRSDYGLEKVSKFPEHYCDIISKMSTDWIPDESKDDFYREMTSVIDNEIITVIRKYVDPTLVSVLMSEFKKGNREFLGMVSSISGEFLKDEYIDEARKELSYISAVMNWNRFKEWEKGRNPIRKALEAKCGYDSKMASHGLRLMRMCVEILEGKSVLVDRTNIDADYLRDVRLGNVSYDAVIEESKLLEAKTTELYKTSILPQSPDFNKVQSLKKDIILEYVFGK